MRLKFKPLSLPKMPLDRWLRLLPVATMAVLLAALVWCLAFLNQYFYQTISDVKLVRTLQNQVTLKQINLPLYQEVLSDLQKKKRPPASSPDDFHDPFGSLTKPAGAADQPALPPTTNLP